MSRLIRFLLGLVGPRRAAAALTLVVLVLLALSPAFAADAPPCGEHDSPAWCATADTGFVSVVTNGGERHEYATAALELRGPVGRGLQVRMRGELLGVQDGGRLDFSRPQSFRAVSVEGELFKTLGATGQFEVAAKGATTLSVEGAVAAPIDPRLWTGQVIATGRLRGVVVRVYGGHDGTVGGWALGAGLDVPIKNAPDFVSDYSYPLSRPAAGALPPPWVITAGARLTFGTWGLADLFK